MVETLVFLCFLVYIRWSWKISQLLVYDVENPEVFFNFLKSLEIMIYK